MTLLTPSNRELQLEFLNRVDHLVTKSDKRRILVSDGDYRLFIEHGGETYRTVLLTGPGLRVHVFTAYNATVLEGWQWNVPMIREHALPMLRKHMVLDDLAEA